MLLLAQRGNDCVLRRTGCVGRVQNGPYGGNLGGIPGGDAAVERVVKDRISSIRMEYFDIESRCDQRWHSRGLGEICGVAAIDSTARRPERQLSVTRVSSELSNAVPTGDAFGLTVPDDLHAAPAVFMAFSGIRIAWVDRDIPHDLCQDGLRVASRLLHSYGPSHQIGPRREVLESMGCGKLTHPRSECTNPGSVGCSCAYHERHRAFV